jgi:hypothetical protein
MMDSYFAYRYRLSKWSRAGSRRSEQALDRSTRSQRYLRSFGVSSVDARDTLRRLPELSGHEADDAEDGRSAVSIAVRWRPEVALNDIRRGAARKRCIVPPRLNGVWTL